MRPMQTHLEAQVEQADAVVGREKGPDPTALVRDAVEVKFVQPSQEPGSFGGMDRRVEARRVNDRLVAASAMAAFRSGLAHAATLTMSGPGRVSPDRD
jgi:hypothetical protein